jgi:hypothetical protein
VASVRANVANDWIVTVQVSPDGRFPARGYTLALLILRPFAVRYGYLSGESVIGGFRPRAARG